MSDSAFGNEIPKPNERLHRLPSVLPNARHSNASGFTLVELSIVLVIIGLLISGLLVGQSMIQAVRTQAFIRQIGQIDIAVSNFRTKYNYLPGDSPYHSASGDGDGWIENSTTDAGESKTTVSHDEEVANFWVHLQQDGFLENEYGTFSADASSGLDAGIHMPYATGVSDNAGIIIYLEEDFIKDRNEYYICDLSPTTDEMLSGSTSKRKAAFTSSQALAIDVKMDDGISGRGTSPNIYSYNGIIWSTNNTDGETGGNDGRCWDASSKDAYLTNNNLECCLMVRMLSQQGGAN